MPRPRFALCSLIFALAPLSATAGEDWPQWRGPDRAGAAALPADGPGPRTDAPPEGLEPVWVANVPGGFEGGWASPVVADGKVYVAVAGRVRKEGVTLPPPEFPRLSDEEEAALPAAEAREYETNRRAENLERRRAAYTGREAIHCFAADDGHHLWTNERDTPVTRFPQSSTPAVVRLFHIVPYELAGRLVQMGGDRVLRCLIAETGETEWETTLPGEFDAEQISSSPLVRPGLNGNGFVCVQAGSLFCVNLQDGTIRWENDRATGRDSSPVGGVVGDRPAIIVNAGGETVGVDSETGDELFRLEETGASRSSPVVAVAADGSPRLLTFGSSRKGGLRCYDLTQNPPELLWKYQKLSDPGASPVVAGDLVLAPGDRRLDCVSLEDGSPRWTTRLDLEKPRYTSPAALVAPDGTGVGLYTFGRLLAFDWTGEAFSPRYDLSVGPKGLLKTEDRWREELGIPAATPEGVARFNKEVTRRGLLPCCSPAISDGKVYVRLQKGLACYALTE